MNLFSEYPVLVGCGHPFRDGGHVPELPLEQLRRLSFLDLNGKDLALDRSRTEALTYALGSRLEIPWFPAAIPIRRSSMAVSQPCLTIPSHRFPRCGTK